MNITDPQGDLLQPRTGTDAGAALDQLRMRYEQLQFLFVVAMAAVVMMALATSLFMLKQYRMVRAQVEEQRPNVQRMWGDYKNTSEPLIQKFTASLQVFAEKNRDFQPILERYHNALRPYFGPIVPAQPAKMPGSSR
jgi:hypothetical protein